MVGTSRRVASAGGGAGAPVESFRGSQAAGQEKEGGKGEPDAQKNLEEKGGRKESRRRKKGSDAPFLLPLSPSIFTRRPSRRQSAADGRRGDM